MPRPRNSIGFQPQEDKENAGHGHHTSRKRAKSLGGSDDITLPILRKRRVAGGSRIPTAPRGILKPSYSAADENHTVIGVMQVLLKDEALAQSKTTNSKTLSRRVSFAPEATLHTFELEREDTQSSSSSIGAHAAGTSASNISDSPNLDACGRSPLANIRLYNEPSPASPRYGNVSRQLQRSTAVVTTPPRGFISSTNFDGYDDEENEDEVEMEDATDVFDDVFVANENLLQERSEPAKLPSNSAESTNSFFSPLVARLRTASSPHTTMRDDFEYDGLDTVPMDITTAMGSIQRSKEVTEIDYNDEATMDITCAVGAIEQPIEEQAMDITTPIGKIQSFPIDRVQDDYYTNVTMDVTKAVGSIHETPRHQDEDETEYTSVTMDVTKAIGEIESAHSEGDDTRQTSLAMDVTVAVGTINTGSVDREDSGNEDSPMDVTFMSSDFAPSVPQGTVAQTANPVPMTNSLPDQEFTTSRQSPQVASTPIAAHSLRRTSSIGFVSGTETPTRSQHAQVLQFKASQISETPTRSPRSAEVLKRRRSLLECEAAEQVFDGSHLSICTPESQKLKSDINTTLFTVSTNGLQKRIQSLTPKKPVRSPIKLPVSSARKQAIEALKVEEQEALSKIYSPLKAASVASPSSSIAKKEIKSLSDIPAPVMQLEPIVDAGDKNSPHSNATIVQSGEEDNYLPISLNEFLRMTSIQFLEGLNTKRRNTTFLQPSEALSEPSLSATVLSRQLHCPMLELFEFSCRELRKNIEEGKELFDKLEVSTTEQNPEIFRQYVCSSLDGQAAFCAQFKFIKSYARLQSKGVWYKWRSKLLDGIMSSLNKNANSLKTDCENLKALEDKLRPSLSDIKSSYSALKSRLDALRKRISEVEDCDQGQLETARLKLADLEPDVRRKLDRRRQLVHESEVLSSSLNGRLSDVRALNDGIGTAEKTVEENKGLDTVEIISTKDKLGWICKLFGWTLKRLSQDTLVLCHEDDLEVEIALLKRTIGRISSIRADSSPVTEYFIQLIASASSNTPLTQALRNISGIWRQKSYLAREIGLVASHYITPIRLEDGTLILKPEILLERSSTKLLLEYRIWIEMTRPHPTIRCETKAHVVYGKVDEAELFTRLNCKLDALCDLGVLQRHCDEISFCV
ncbi:Spc7 kinetochore protein-domain-containing protein [Lipomyces kononenkoae]